MSSQRDHSKQRRNDHPFKNLPTEVLLKARSTLFSLGGALKSKNDSQQSRMKILKDTKDKKSNERLKNSRSEPEFSEARKNKHRSRIDEVTLRNYPGNPKPRPLSVGAVKRHDKDTEDFHYGSFQRDVSPLRQRQFDSTEEVCVQSRLVIPVVERLSGQDVQMLDASERPRKKLSFREPEIVCSGSATLGRSNKLMGVNSLTRRPNRVSLRSDTHSSSLEGLDSDLESQAMRIVRTVGQAFEVCHKMQVNSPDQPAASTSSAVDDVIPADCPSDIPASKEGVSDCGASESGAASTSKVVVEEAIVREDQRPKHLEFLPPPPRKESKRSPQRTIPTPSINLPDLPECITKVEITSGDAGEVTTPLSTQHQLQLLRERLEQQAQQTRAAVAQLLLLRDQLAAEQAARCEAQARTHQLLVHNKELLEHIAALVAHLQEREKGCSQPINAQQLTLLPQAKADGGTRDTNAAKNFAAFNGKRQQVNNDALIDLFAQGLQINQNMENNNPRLQGSMTPVPEMANGSSSAPSFGGMTNEQIQNYLISKFQDMGGFPNSVNEPKRNSFSKQQFYQNSNAFPNIPPLTNHYSNSDLASLMNHNVYKEIANSTDELGAIAQAMSVGQSENSLYSNSQATTSKDSTPEAFSSDDGAPFIMPLSHNCTLTATGEDGRVRLIVPVSPSESTSDVPEMKEEPQGAYGHTLKVPGQDRLLAPAAPITRSTSEKVPNRSEMMTALRSQWTRHTTK